MQPIYQISLDSLDTYSSTGKTYMDPGTLRIVSKARNSFAISGNFTFVKPMGNEVLVTVVVSRKGSTGKMVPAIRQSMSLCAWMEDKKYYPTLAKFSTFLLPAPCPYPKGEVAMKDFVVDEEFLPMVLPKGEYLTDIRMTLGDEVVFGYKIMATIS